MQALSQLSYGPELRLSLAPDPAARTRSDGCGLDLDARHVAPQILEPVVRPRVRREDVQHDVEVVGDDPARLALPSAVCGIVRASFFSRSRTSS